MVRLLTDRDFDLSVAQDTAVVDAQYARIGEKIDALAAQYGFEPKTVMDLVTRERLLDYHAQMGGLAAEFDAARRGLYCALL